MNVIVKENIANLITGIDVYHDPTHKKESVIGNILSI